MNIRTFRNSLLILLLNLPILTTAQHSICSTAEVNNRAWEQDPEKRALAERLNREALEYTEAHYGERAGSIKVIPIVFHVIHDHGSENLSKNSILNALETLNAEFGAENGNLSSIIPEFENIIADSEIEFRLARLDPNGNCTDGITRTISALTHEAGENVKDLISWNTTRYLNIWVVGSVGSGAGGYAYYPGNAPSQSHEGIVLRYAQLASSISHEVGHYLNLRHTWGNSNDNAEPGNCSSDDNVADTPNTIGSEQECNTNQMTCGSLDNVQNHMDYSTCGRMFTEGQKARMHAALNSNEGGRNNLWLANTLTLTGTNDGFTNVCVPVIDFSLDNATGCEGMEVEFEDNSWNSDLDSTWIWTWTFEGGDPATSDQQHPTVTYNTAGVYDVTLNIQNSAGNESETIQDAVTVTALAGGFEGAFLEGVEDSDFPENADPQLEWTIEADGSPTWGRNTTAAFSGNASVRINLRSISTGTINNLISPPLNFTDVEPDDATMTFRMAHAPRTGGGSERLRIYASRNCGETWTLRYTKSGSALSTNGGSNVFSTFIPDQNEWREETVSLNTMAGDERVIIRFEATSDEQNYLYIDDINIASNTTIGIGESDPISSTTVYPNPVSEGSVLEIGARERMDVNIAIVNLLGQELGSIRSELKDGLNRIGLSEIVAIDASGVFFILIETDTARSSLKFTKQ